MRYNCARESNRADAQTPIDLEALRRGSQRSKRTVEAREERIKLLEEENRWLKAQLFGRSSEKTAAEEISPEQALAVQRGRGARPGGRVGARDDHDPRARAQQARPQEALRRVAASRGPARPARDREDLRRTMARRSSASARRSPSSSTSSPPRCGSSGTSGPSTPARAATRGAASRRCRCSSSLRAWQPLAAGAHRDRQVRRWPAAVPPGDAVRTPGRHARARDDGRLDDPARRHARGAADQPVERAAAAQPLIHCDETRLQVLKSDKAPTADHWMWVRAAVRPAGGSCSSTTMPRGEGRCRCGCCRATGYPAHRRL